MKQLVLIAALVSQTAFATPANGVKITVKGPVNPALVVPALVPLAFMDNGNGTSTLVVDACGTEITVVMPNKLVGSQEVDQEVMPHIERACKEFLN